LNSAVDADIVNRVLTHLSRALPVYIASGPVGAMDPLHGDPPSEALVAISKICEVRTGQGRQPPLTAPERLCGRVVNVVIWEETHWEIIVRHEVAVGGFIRLRNVGERFHQELGLRCKWHQCLYSFVIKFEFALCTDLLFTRLSQVCT
jgi:hypothetical protein